MKSKVLKNTCLTIVLTLVICFCLSFLSLYLITDSYAYGDNYSYYYIEFDDNTGYNGPGWQYKETGETIYISDIIPQLDGYSFMGWSTDPYADKAEYKPGDPYSLDADLYLYAVWGYSITYNANGGKGAPTTQNGSLFGSSTYVSSKEPTRDGYYFLGWSDEKDSEIYTEPVYCYMSGDEINESIVLYAIWGTKCAYYGDGCDLKNKIIAATLTKDGKCVSECTECGYRCSVKYTIPHPKKFVLSKKTYTYDGNRKKPEITVYDTKGNIIREQRGYWGSGYNYEIKYYNNKNAGTAKVKIIFQGEDYSGKKEIKFTIKPKKVSKDEVVIDNYAYDYSYTGKTISLKGVKLILNDGNGDGEENYKTIKLKKDKGYTIKYNKTPKTIGSYKATLQLKGNYSGKFTYSFKIIPSTPKTKIKKLSNSKIKITWKKVKGAQGYKIYQYNSKKDKYVLLKTTKSTSCIAKKMRKSDDFITFYVVAYKKVGSKTYYSYESWGNKNFKPGKATFKLKLSDVRKIKITPETSGYYEIQLSTDSKFSSVEVFNEYIYDVLYIKNLSPETKYYVRIRKYNYDEKDEIQYGAWSSVKTIKT